ncbi:MAG: hypothetical protein A2Z86_05820 [Candidatus Glassbacteria bacterium GWA2_58_10]|uniref:Cytochrome c domain-containing protein n=1 Tax=Candidatus Glassbacteria bacterium GWA2_58_10 TaxID=1817865 RepID=A0A1F5YF44_9BACT|nr:MAG: hypothetical protein A2Z86_05820 [Candidatus Glassbacteria bacterium GWA2_58_10]
MRCLKFVVASLILLAGAGLLFIYSGLYNISAIHKDNALVRWVLETTMEHSLRHHAAAVQVPALDDSAMIHTGFVNFREMCVECHGAPGVEAGELAAGLNPPAPDLTAASMLLSPAELFWITKNGVKMTGMPAWGPTHPDEKIWGIVAFMGKLSGLTPADYGEMVRRAEEGGEKMEKHEHHHGQGEQHGGTE